MERLSLSDKQQVKLGLSLGFLASITLIGYEVARSASYTLFKFDYGTENLPIVMTFIPLAAIASLFIYDLMLNKWGPKWTLMLSTLISAVTFFLCYIGLLFKVKLASGVLFVFREIYIVILIEQYWSYINSGITKEMARQLNGPLIGISTLGSMVGGLLLGFATKSLGTLNMLLIPILLCIPAFFISHIIYKKFGEPMAQKKPHNFFKVTGLKSLFSNKRLSFLFFVIVFTQLVATVLDLAFQSRVQEAFPQLDEQTSKLGFFYGTLNGVALFSIYTHSIFTSIC